MRKLLIILFLLILALPVQSATMVSGRPCPGGAASACTACTGGLTFAAYFEAAGDGDVTKGSPCGCSTGDTTGAAADSCTIESGYLWSADAGKYYVWDVSTDDIISDTEGSMLIEFEVKTWVSGAVLFGLVVTSGQDNLYVSLGATDDINAIYEGQNAGPVSIATSGVTTCVVDTVYFAIVRWTTEDVNPNFTVTVYDSSHNQRNTPGTSDTNLTTFTSTPGAGTFVVGNYGASEAAIRIHSIKIWNTFAGAGF
jgi:hypothetical protein